MNPTSVPISTRWLLDSVGNAARSTIGAIYLVACPNVQSKGTGFLLNSGSMVTNWHVVCHCNAKITGARCSCDPTRIVQDVLAIGSGGQEQRFQRLTFDQGRDLAIMEPDMPLQGGLSIRPEFDIPVGTQVSTWGHPLGYDGPPPILTTGYLAGFSEVANPVC